VSSKSRKQMENSRELALRHLEYAMALTIQLLSGLDGARAQIRMLKDDQDGRMIDTPRQARVLDAAVKSAFRACAAISSAAPRPRRQRAKRSPRA
jgi:hypothetical protein